MASWIWISWSGSRGYFSKRTRSFSEVSRTPKGLEGSGAGFSEVSAGIGFGVSVGGGSGGWFSLWVLLHATEQLNLASVVSVYGNQ